MKSRKRVFWSVVLVLVVVFVYYRVDNARIKSGITTSVQTAFQGAMDYEMSADPGVIASTVPKPQQSDLYNTVKDNNTVDNSYRIINVDNYWITRQIATNALIYFNQGDTSPVSRITSWQLYYAPAFENLGANVNVQYVDPFGIVRNLHVNITVPLTHKPLS